MERYLYSEIIIYRYMVKMRWMVTRVMIVMKLVLPQPHHWCHLIQSIAHHLQFIIISNSQTILTTLRQPQPLPFTVFHPTMMVVTVILQEEQIKMQCHLHHHHLPQLHPSHWAKLIITFWLPIHILHITNNWIIWLDWRHKPRLIRTWLTLPNRRAWLQPPTQTTWCLDPNNNMIGILQIVTNSSNILLNLTNPSSNNKRSNHLSNSNTNYIFNSSNYNSFTKLTPLLFQHLLPMNILH